MLRSPGPSSAWEGVLGSGGLLKRPSSAVASRHGDSILGGSGLVRAAARPGSGVAARARGAGPQIPATLPGSLPSPAGSAAPPLPAPRRAAPPPLSAAPPGRLRPPLTGFPDPRSLIWRRSRLRGLPRPPQPRALPRPATPPRRRGACCRHAPPRLRGTPIARGCACAHWASREDVT